MGEFSAPSLLNIFAIVIHPDRRSRGLGTQLVETAVQHAAKAGLAMACSVCTSHHSQVGRSLLALSSYSLWQAICTKLGFTKKVEVLYKDFSIDGKKVFEENQIQYLQKSAISYYKILSI
jgi:GNAT superfamily N-acetyltransferase